MVDEPPLPLARGGDQHLFDDLRQGGGIGVDGTGQRVATQGAEAHQLLLHFVFRAYGHALVIHHDLDAIALHHWAMGGKVERHYVDVLEIDVLPDVQLGPVGEREHPDALPLVDLAVVDAPQLRALVLRIPAVGLVTEGVDPLLGTGLLLVAAGAAEGGIEAVFVERLLEPLCLHDVGVLAAAVHEGVDVHGQAVRVLVDDEIQPVLLGGLVPELDHLLELPVGVHVEQREGDLARIEGLAGQVQHDGGVLADGVHHHRVLELGGHLADDVDALGFQLLQVGKSFTVHVWVLGSLLSRLLGAQFWFSSVPPWPHRQIGSGLALQARLTSLSSWRLASVSACSPPCSPNQASCLRKATTSPMTIRDGLTACWASSASSSRVPVSTR